MIDELTHSSPPSAPRRVISVGVTVWRIFEHVPTYDRRSRPSLVFASDVAMRRVRDFPERWWELSDDALMALSWRR